MAKKKRQWIAPVAILALLTGGYVVADIQDVAPGVLTTDPPWPEPEPFPTLAQAEVLDPTLPGGPDPDAPVPQASQIQVRIDRLVEDLNGAVTVVVADALTGQTLGSHQPGMTLVPASTTKLATGIAAIEAAGSDYRFTTEVALEGDDRLYLIGGGDLMLAADYGNHGSINGYAGLAELADQVSDYAQAAGISNLTLSVDHSLYQGPILAPGWHEGDPAGGWTMPIHPLAVELGVMPDSEQRSANSGLDTAQIFADLLRDRGLQISDEVTIATAPEGATGVAVVESAPLADVVSYMLVTSDNVAAEAIGRLVAQSRGEEVSFAGAGRAIIAQLDELGIDTTGMILGDASGLSSSNAISGQSLAQMAGLITTQPALHAVVTGIPVGGLEGTLATRMRGTVAAGAVFAKTGTLPVSVALAGIVETSEGRILNFGVITNEPAEGNWAARVYIDEFMADLAECGCQ